MSTISPHDALVQLQAGAKLIDIRAIDEYRREYIPAAIHCTITDLQTHGLPTQAQSCECLIFHCAGGIRTREALPTLQQLYPNKQIYLLENGIQGWKQAGLATTLNPKQPLPLMRQVQIAAGALALSGTLAGAFIHPNFYFIPGFVGTGLMVAGITGFCGMARLLAIMPWNKS
ncbi:MAG: rhodanese family protein [Pelistega sp.]|nr:rhodanese family protein [Pelistega sp.]